MLFLKTVTWYVSKDHAILILPALFITPVLFADKIK